MTTSQGTGWLPNLLGVEVINDSTGLSLGSVTELRFVAATVAVSNDRATVTVSPVSGEIDDAQHGNRAGGTLHPAVSTTVAGFVPAVGGTPNRVLVTTSGSAAVWGQVTGDMLDASAALAATQLAAGGAGNVLLGGASSNSWGQVANAQISSSAAIAVSKLAAGASGTVLIGGASNTFSANPAVTSVTASSYVASGASPATDGDVRLPSSATIQARNSAGGGNNFVVYAASVTGDLYFGPDSSRGGTTNHTRLRSYGGNVLVQKDGSTLATFTATTATFNFGSNDVVVGDGYVNVASAATTGGVRVLASGTVGREAYVTSRITGDTLDRHLLSLYGSAMVVGCHAATSLTDGWDEVYVAANTAIHLTTTGFGSALTGVEVQDGLVALKATAISATGYLTVGGAYVAIGTNPAQGGALRLPNNQSLQFRNAANDGDYNAIGVGSTGILYVGGNSATTYPVSTYVACSASGSVLIRVGGATQLTIGDGLLGFFSATPAAKPTVSGSRGSNAALTDLLTELATLGLITNSTTA